MPPSASEPESGSVMAHAPIFSKVSRSRPQRSICSRVPSFITVPPASPVDTPSEVTMPGLTRQSSMVGMRLSSTELRARSPSGGPSPLRFRSIARSKDSRASSSRPKVRYILRIRS